MIRLDIEVLFIVYDKKPYFTYKLNPYLTYFLTRKKIKKSHLS
jgi:hypothetical protein